MEFDEKQLDKIIQEIEKRKRIEQKRRKISRELLKIKC